MEVGGGGRIILIDSWWLLQGRERVVKQSCPATPFLQLQAPLCLLGIINRHDM